MSGKLPVAYGLPDPADAAVLELAVQWTRKSSFRSPFTVPRVVGLFQTLGESGGYAGSRYAPEGSRLSLVKRQVDDRGGYWCFQTAGLDPGALGVLTRILDFSHRHVDPLQRVVVRTSLRMDNGEVSPLRGCSADLPFDVGIVAESPDLHVEVQLAGTPSAETSACLKSILSSWQYLAAAGAFEQGVAAPDRALLLPERKPVLLQDLLFAIAQGAAFDEAAFDALLNALRGVHVTRHALLSVEVS
jgi:hypothetical protein